MRAPALCSRARRSDGSGTKDQWWVQRLLQEMETRMSAVEGEASKVFACEWRGGGRRGDVAGDVL